MTRIGLRRVLFVATLFALGCGGTQPNRVDAPVSPAQAAPYSRVEMQVLGVVNEARHAEGRGALEWRDDLAALARAHSRAMASGEVSFGHAGIGPRLSESMAIRGTRAAAENVSRQPRAENEVATRSIERWLGSPEHRKNLLGEYAVTGIGVARGADGAFYVTQIFTP